MQTNLTIDVRTVYGNTMYYPACEVSTLLVKLTGKKTFSLQDLNTLKKIGYSITPKPLTI